MPYLFALLALTSTLTQAAYFPELLCVTTPMKVGTKIFTIEHDESAYSLKISAKEVVDFDEAGISVKKDLGEVTKVIPKKVYGERFELKSSIGYLEIKAHYGSGKFYGPEKASRLECADLE